VVVAQVAVDLEQLVLLFNRGQYTRLLWAVEVLAEQPVRSQHLELIQVSMD